jgi:DNA mismatch endonuclease (patch repair protein)
MDKLDQGARSALMRRIRATDTGPELAVRSALHRAGVRFRLHAFDLPGKPDLVNRTRRFAVFVHGCFWHAHQNCRFAARPKTRPDFWASKLEANRRRDSASIQALAQLGYRTAVVWECSLKKAESSTRAHNQLLKWVNGRAQHVEINSD